MPGAPGEFEHQLLLKALTAKKLKASYTSSLRPRTLVANRKEASLSTNWCSKSLTLTGKKEWIDAL
jgi:hypothetical protein